MLAIERRGAVEHLRLHRLATRNALNDALIGELQSAFAGLPGAARAIVLGDVGAKRRKRVVIDGKAARVKRS